jgi:competence ComEA-like helix-hairpin-helix protein
VTHFAESYIRSVLGFQRAMFESTFHMVSQMQDLGERTLKSLWYQNPLLPDDGKVMIDQWLGTMQEGRNSLRRTVRENFEQMSDTLGKQASEASSQMSEGWRQFNRETLETGKTIAQAASRVYQAHPDAEESQQAREPHRSEKLQRSPARSASDRSGGKACRLNDADKEALENLFGIGEATAAKIVSFRKENGRFKDWVDLEEIPGIRNSIISRLKEECEL